MNRREFLQLCGLLPLLPFLYKTPVQAEPYDSSMGQWVFDGANGLIFPINEDTNRVNITNFRALSFFERILGGVR